MSFNCPNCGKQLKIGEKAESGLLQMPAGKVIKVKCTQCGEPFGINSQKDVVVLGESGGGQGKKSLSKIIKADGKKTGVVVRPPAPPDLGWLIDGVYEGHDVVEEVPLALVLMADSPDRLSVINAIEGLGYRAETAASSNEAIEKMLFVNFSNVVLHSNFEPGGIENTRFHKYMSRMEMSKRRYLFYSLIGPEFQTLYNLQALTYSANLVVNDSEIKFFNVILRKVIPEYEALFGPLMEELHLQKK